MRAVGIHLDSDVLAAVQVDGSLRNPEISRFACEPMPVMAPGNPLSVAEFRAHALEDFLKRHKFSRDTIYVALDSDQCLHRVVTVPFTNDEQIRRTIRFQAEAHIHSANIDDLELTWRKLVQRQASSDVMVNVIKRGALRGTLSALKSHNLDPFGVDTPFAAGANAILFHPDAKLEEGVLWVDVGVDSTVVALTHTGELLGLRLPKVGLSVAPRDVETEAHVARMLGPIMPAAVTGLDGMPTLPVGTPRHVAYEPAAVGSAPLALPSLDEDGVGPPDGVESPEAGGSPAAAQASVVVAEPQAAAALGPQESGALAVAPLEARAELGPAAETLMLSASTVLTRPDVMVRRFVTELKRTVVSLAAASPPRKMRLSGGGEAIEILAAALRQSFPGMEIVVLSPGMGLSVRPDAEVAVRTRNQGLG